MSLENVELVRAGFDAFNAGGIEAVLPFLSGDVVFVLGRRVTRGPRLSWP